MIVTGGVGCDDESERKMVLVVMMIVTDDGGCDDGSVTDGVGCDDGSDSHQHRAFIFSSWDGNQFCKLAHLSYLG